MSPAPAPIESPPESEEMLQEQLERYFESNGWMAIREVSPHSGRCRADLIVKHDDYGWFGIEAKHFAPGDGGSKLADAHYQIVSQYRARKYLGERINRWVLAPWFVQPDTPDDEWRGQRRLWRHRFSREMLCRHGVGVIDLNRADLLMDFAYSRAECKVPVGERCASRHYESVEPGTISEMVTRKIDKWDY